MQRKASDKPGLKYLFQSLSISNLSHTSENKFPWLYKYCKLHWTLFKAESGWELFMCVLVAFLLPFLFSVFPFLSMNGKHHFHWVWDPTHPGSFCTSLVPSCRSWECELSDLSVYHDSCLYLKKTLLRSMTCCIHMNIQDLVRNNLNINMINYAPTHENKQKWEIWEKGNTMPLFP